MLAIIEQVNSPCCDKGNAVLPLACPILLDPGMPDLAVCTAWTAISQIDNILHRSAMSLKTAGSVLVIETRFLINL